MGPLGGLWDGGAGLAARRSVALICNQEEEEGRASRQLVFQLKKAPELGGG